MEWLSRFKRVTKRGFIPEIDGLRFLAIMPVVILHSRTAFLKNSEIYNENNIQASWLDSLLQNGTTGVIIFFTISGFILAIPFARYNLGIENTKKISLKRYFYRRLTRLEPPYIIVMTGLLLILIVQGQKFLVLLPHYLASIFYSHNLIYSKWSVINPVTWSLEVEIQFYILVPLLTSVFLVNQKILRRVLIFITIYCMIYLKYNFELPYKTILSFGHYFLIGFLIADLYLLKDLFTDKINRYVLDFFGILSIYLIFTLRYHDFQYEWLEPIWFLMLYFCVFNGHIINKFFSNPLITTIGGMCYITYLIHYPLAYFLTIFTSKLTTNTSYDLDLSIQFLIVLPVIFIVSAVAFVLIEKPFMHHDWPEKLKAYLKGEKSTSAKN